jgi:hypothetical protein
MGFYQQIAYEKYVYIIPYTGIYQTRRSYRK